MAWLILNDFDFDKAKCIATDKKFPVMEGFEMTHEGKVSKNLDELTRPRTMETHLPVQLLPDEIWTKKPYMIYISRDPRDVAVSTYYTAKEKFHMPLSKDEFLERFLKDQNVYAPYREHRLNFWNIPDYPNILYLTYEWITENIDDAIWKVAGFLGKTISEENFHKLREYLKDSMEKGGINRKSKAGRYKEEMSPEIQEKFDVWMAEEATMVSAFKK